VLGFRRVVQQFAVTVTETWGTWLLIFGRGPR
jgi:hypothetical protein